MRVVGGTFKGRSLEGPVRGTHTIRPSSDRLREALFNILIHNGLLFTDSAGLDLFAGTGALGIEACSRGAQKVFWVEQDPDAVRLIHKNLENMGLNESSDLQVLATTVAKAFASTDLQAGAPFRWVFFDPPYATDLAVETLNLLMSKNETGLWLEPGAWIVAETSARARPHWGKRLDEGLEHIVTRTYGDSQLWCWRTPERNE